MKRTLEWISLLGAVAALGINVMLPGLGSDWIVIAAAGISAGAAVIDLAFEPKRLLLLGGFLPSLLFVFSIFVLENQSAGPNTLVAFILALQARLFFLRAGDSAKALNRSFAGDLKSSLPEKALVFVDADIEGEAPISSLQRDHLVRIKPGEAIPADGQVTFGSSFVDESPLTGDHESVTKSMGSYVYAGSRNKNGSFLLRVGDEPAKSIALRLSAALEKGFPFESVFSPAFFALEALAFVGAAALILTGASTTAAFGAFLLSTGTAFAAALWVRESVFVAHSSAEGFAWQNREAVLSVASAGAVVSAATGVLTEGRIKLMAVAGTESLSEDGALRLVGPLARRLEDEYSFAILREMLSRNIRLELLDAFQQGPKGISGLIDGEEVRWMNLETARLEGFPLASLAQFAEERLLAGESVQVLARAGKAAAAFAFGDPISPEASSGLKALQNEDLPFVLVARDSPLAIVHLQRELFLNHAHPESDEKDVERLLEKMGGEGVKPLWIASPLWKVENPTGVTLVAGIPGMDVTGEVHSIRRNVASVVKLIRIARRYAAGKRTYLFWALFFQVGLLPLALLLDPRLIALVSALGGYFLVSLARRTR
jgi:P-type Cu+ transporter